MRFALLAADEEALPLIQAISDCPQHSLISISESSTITAAVRSIFGVDINERSWESLLHDPEAEAVVVGRGSEAALRADQLRKLVQAGLPLIVFHPVCDMLTGFELQMIQRDSHAPILPYFPGCRHPLFQSRTTGESAQESVQVVMDRKIRGTSRREIQDQFSRDTFLLRQKVGRFDRIGALSAQAAEQAEWANLSIHMSNNDGALARWSGAAGVTETGANVTMTTGEQRLEYQSMDADWKAHGNGDGRAESYSLVDEATAVLDDIANHAGRRQTIDERWDNACRSEELADTIEASLRRNKTIELYHEEHTEEETFKGMMAAGGCLAMMFTLLIVPVLAAVESMQIPFLEHPMFQQWPMRLLYWRNWPYYLLGVLVLFLSLQLFRFAFKRGPRAD